MNIFSIAPSIRFNVSKTGVVLFKIIASYPQTQEKRDMLNASVEKIHVEYVEKFIERLECSTEQKLKLLDEIARTVMEASKEFK